MLHDDCKELASEVVVRLWTVALQHINPDLCLEEDVAALELPGGKFGADLAPLGRLREGHGELRHRQSVNHTETGAMAPNCLAP